MFEKVNPAHPDKVADRIAGAVVDIAYETQIDPKVAVEVLIGHGICHIIAETSATLNENKVIAAVHRIAGNLDVDLVVVPQDTHLARNQKDTIRCGDNGIFKGVPMTEEQRVMSNVARAIYAQYPFDGKYILDGDRLIICQSNVNSDTLRFQYPGAIVNPLAPTQVAKEPGAVLSGYTVRRLTPTECARLQGFPDWWCSGLGTTEPTAEELAFWTEVWETHRRITSPSTKVRSSWRASPTKPSSTTATQLHGR